MDSFRCLSSSRNLVAGHSLLICVIRLSFEEASEAWDDWNLLDFKNLFNLLGNVPVSRFFLSSFPEGSIKVVVHLSLLFHDSLKALRQLDSLNLEFIKLSLGNMGHLAFKLAQIEPFEANPGFGRSHLH